MKKITTTKNEFIKSLVELQEKAKVRKQSKTFLIEGRREISLALKKGYIIKTLLFCEEICTLKEVQELYRGEELISISLKVYQKLAYRDTTEGVIAVGQNKTLTLSELKLNKNSLLLVAESPEKPGNIGALLRTADAAHLDAVIIANPKGDLYNPNIIRSSVGCLFTTQIATGTTLEVIQFLQDNTIDFYCATLQDAVPYDTQDYSKSTAIVVGTEATGLTEVWKKQAKKNIIIPMEGIIDSMNVSVAAAVLIFEAKRQRKLLNIN